MLLRAILTLSLGAALSGCFFSLDGSLVDRKPDARPREAGAESSPGGDARRDHRSSEARAVDLPGAVDLGPKLETKPAG